MRTTTKLMMDRTIFDSTVPPTTDLYKTVNQIINLDAEKVVLHPSDGRRVLRALRYFTQDKERFIQSRL